MVGLWAGDSLHSNNVVLAFAPPVMNLITTAPGCWNGADARSTQGTGGGGGCCDSSGSQFIGPTGLLRSVIACLLVARGPRGGRLRCALETY